jgi:HK97 family phage major capsid protein
MGNNYSEIKLRIKEATDRAESIVAACEREHRHFTSDENLRFSAAQREVESLTAQAEEIRRKNTILNIDPRSLMLGGNPDVGAAMTGSAIASPRRTLPPGYLTDVAACFKSRGKVFGPALQSVMDEVGGFPLWGRAPRPGMSAALYEGVDSAGGYAVPITVDDQIVPLAPTEMGVRRLAMVIPTTMDIKIPQKASFGTAALTPETTEFGGTATALSQFTLTANMIGSQEQISWELAQDVPAFQAFVVDDMILAQQMEEEPLYLTGSGSGQPQGLIGNVGAGVTEEPDTNGNLVSITGTLDLIGQLNAMYHFNAAWLMARPTSIVIRKAQVESNLFNPVWTRVGGQDYLHGYPVEYSGFMPSAARGNAPILFGDFKRGYIIGDRGGSGINVKVLDQVMAQYGILVLLAYRRTDGRVRRSEAIQQYNIALS